MNQLFATAVQFFPDLTLAIIALTFFLRLVLSPLQFMSAKAAKKMKEIQPELSLLREKWKDDSRKIQEETMKLFKQKSVNPFTSFIPVLLQLPLFYIFYNLLTTFPGIIGTTLAVPDPLFILPIVAGILQFVLMYFSSQDVPDSAMGKKLRVIMPLVFTGIMLKLPVAVLIYTITSSIYSIVEKGAMNKFML